MERITEIKKTLSGRVDRFACEVVERSEAHAIVLYRIPEGRDVHGVWLPAGATTVAYFWVDRPFNLYHWLEPTGKTLAYYFNVGDVARLEAGVLEWHDYAVDILATPDGRVQVLDEDELPNDMNLKLRAHVQHARDRILGELPELIRKAERRSKDVLARVGRHHHSPSTNPAIRR